MLDSKAVDIAYKAYRDNYYDRTALASIEAAITAYLAALPASPVLADEGVTANRIKELEGYLAFVARWAWRESEVLTDTERLSTIKYYPPIKAIAAP